MPPPPQAGKPQTKRLPALAAVLLAHAALIAWLVALVPAMPPATVTPALTLVPLPAAPPPPAEPLPAPPPLVLPSLAPPDLPEIPAEPLPTTTAAACAPQESVAAALADDPAVRAAVAAVPPAQRSVTGATIVWNAGWAAVTRPGAPLARVRAAVAQALAPLAPTCLAQPVAGPRLFPVPTGQETRFLVFGSGIWHWSDLEPSG